MATTYKDQFFAVQQDTVFVGRITAAGVQAAIAIYAEAGTVPSHSARAAYAIKVMQSPESYARPLAWAVVADPTLDATSTDAALFSRINAQWNVLAGI